MTTAPASHAIVGLGCLALDLLDSDGSFSLPAAGSTVGNVMAILSAMGWHSIPVARIGADTAASLLLRDLRRFGVDTSFIECDPSISTPVWLERLDGDTRSVRHRYVGTCPTCRHHLPRAVRPTRSQIEMASDRLIDAHVLLVDQATHDAVALAKTARAHGVLVLFEASASAPPELLRHLIELTDILKYANDRYSDLGTPYLGHGALEIESLGARGLRFRVIPGDWQYRGAAPVRDLIDAAGCGDWLTAGILEILVGQRHAKTRAALQSGLEETLYYGQQLAARNCGFVGARGEMALPAFGTAPFVKRAISAPEPDTTTLTSVDICPKCRPQATTEPDS